MDSPKKRRGLHIKLILVSFISLSIPLIVIFVTKNPLFTAVSAALSFFLAVGEIFVVLKPLQNFLKAADGLKGGNLNFRLDVRSKDEFEEVADSLNQMAQKLAETFQKEETTKNLYLDQNHKLETVLSSIIDGVVALDNSGRIVLANKPAQYLTGYTPSEIQGKGVEEIIHLFNETEQLPSKVYCQQDFNQKLMLVDKDGKQQQVNITATKTAEGMQSNLSCILIIHDLSREQELEQMKLDFVSMASHELKTPLTSLIGYLSVFINENKDKLPKDSLDLLSRSLVSAQSLFTLIENLLSVNKIEREQLSVIIEPSDYLPILTKSVEDNQNQAKLKNITLTLKPPPALPKILLDQIRTGEVVNNLISNAIKYTPAGGAVGVSVELTPTEVITTISDNGIGIPKEALPKLFSKFFRVSNVMQKTEKGTGLGLFIAKSIIEKLNGKIWVESETGKGTKFHFSLPTVSQSQANINENQFVSESIQAGALNY